MTCISGKFYKDFLNCKICFAPVSQCVCLRQTINSQGFLVKGHRDKGGNVSLSQTYNGTGYIRGLCIKATILACHRCLIFSLKNEQLQVITLTARCLYIKGTFVIATFSNTDIKERQSEPCLVLPAQVAGNGWANGRCKHNGRSCCTKSKSKQKHSLSIDIYLV